jgi:addiction module HigA family antidote
MIDSDLLANPHPGEILLEEFLKPMGISQYRLAIAGGLPHSRVTDLIKRRRGVTADTALRLARCLGTSPEFWLGLQRDYDLEEAQRVHGKDYARLPQLIVA